MRVNEKSVCCYVVDAWTSSCTIEHDANAVRLYFIETKDALVADGRCLLFLINLLAELKNRLKISIFLWRKSCASR